jgi:hypothetical protein
MVVLLHLVETVAGTYIAAVMAALAYVVARAYIEEHGLRLFK